MKRLLFISLAFNFLFFTLGLVVIYRVGGMRYLIYKIRNFRKNNEYYSKTLLFGSMPSCQNKIVFLGDSITEQCDWSELLERDDVINRGIGGDVTTGVLARTGSILEQHPKKVFLMIGINDLLMAVPEERILNNYKKILDTFKTFPETEFFIQSILPVNNNVLYNKNISSEDITSLNAKIRKEALDRGFAYIDLFDALTLPDQSLDAAYTTDGLHLNGKAYVLWKNRIQYFM